MNSSSLPPSSAFDTYAHDYDAALTKGIALSGESKEYFAYGRVSWLAHCIRELGQEAGDVLDYGCGNGTATPYLLEVLGARSVLGIDVSGESLAVAERAYGSERVRFRLLEDYRPNGEIDMVFCNGVFHHIPPPLRAGTIEYINRALRPGGLFALWENNPWNPGTRLVMRRIPFDRDAITLSAPEARRLVCRGEFGVLRTDFLFIFPRIFGWFRGIEPYLSRLPLGAQYQVLCQSQL